MRHRPFIPRNGSSFCDHDHVFVLCRVDGVNLLEDAIKQGKTGSDLDDSDDEEGSGAEDHLSHLEGQHNIDSDDSDVQAESDSEHVTEGDSDALHFSNISAGHPEAVPEDDQEGSDEDVESEADLSENEEDDDNSGGDVLSDSGDQSDDAAADVEHDEHQGERRGRQRKKAKVACPTKAKQAPSTDSLKQLKQKIAQAEAKKSRVNCAIERTTSTNPRADDETEDIPLEQMRVLTQEDFERIRKLKARISLILSSCTVSVNNNHSNQLPHWRMKSVRISKTYWHAPGKEFFELTHRL